DSLCVWCSLGDVHRCFCAKHDFWNYGQNVQPWFHQTITHFPTFKGMVKVGAFRQNCRQCDEAPMEEASVEEEKLEKCYRENLGKRNNRHFDNDKGPPHESSHCKACSKGISTKRLKCW
uniref:3CxxC-type domain-containing protein n=1 Tax=Esox lucius TaxID=8010 RepID=A0A3P8XHM1_ESOLU